MKTNSNTSLRYFAHKSCNTRPRGLTRYGLRTYNMGKYFHWQVSLVQLILMRQKYFLVVCLFVCLFVCLLRLRVPRETASLVHSLPIRPEKGLAYDVMFTSGTHAVLARDVMYTSVTHAGLVRDVAHTHCQKHTARHTLPDTHCQTHTVRHTLPDTHCQTHTVRHKVAVLSAVFATLKCRSIFF